MDIKINFNFPSFLYVFVGCMMFWVLHRCGIFQTRLLVLAIKLDCSLYVDFYLSTIFKLCIHCLSMLNEIQLSAIYIGFCFETWTWCVTNYFFIIIFFCNVRFWEIVFSFEMNLIVVVEALRISWNYEPVTHGLWFFLVFTTWIKSLFASLDS